MGWFFVVSRKCLFLFGCGNRVLHFLFCQVCSSWLIPYFPPQGKGGNTVITQDAVGLWTLEIPWIFCSRCPRCWPGFLFLLLRLLFACPHAPHLSHTVLYVHQRSGTPLIVGLITVGCHCFSSPARVCSEPAEIRCELFTVMSSSLALCWTHNRWTENRWKCVKWDRMLFFVHEDRRLA